jgi:predicted SAM-dependent methyltransferase
MSVKTWLKNALSNRICERVVSEVAVEVRVLFLTRFPNLIFPWRWIQLRNAEKLTGIKVNLGCGPHLDPGWVGIDYRARNALRCDVKGRLPFRDESCRFLFSEHVFEHLDLRELHRVLCECHRVLEPGGVLRIVTPDLKLFVSAYNRGDESFGKVAFGTQAPVAHTLNRIFELVTHRFIHDFSSLEAELHAVGFSDVRESSFRNSSFPELNIDLDDPSRTATSLYVDAIKGKRA